MPLMTGSGCLTDKTRERRVFFDLKADKLLNYFEEGNDHEKYIVTLQYVVKTPASMTWRYKRGKSITCGIVNACSNARKRPIWSPKILSTLRSSRLGRAARRPMRHEDMRKIN